MRPAEVAIVWGRTFGWARLPRPTARALRSAHGRPPRLRRRRRHDAPRRQAGRRRQIGAAGREPPPADAPAGRRRPDELRRKAIHQPKDKTAKALFGDQRVAAEFLAAHVLGKVVPAELAERTDLAAVLPIVVYTGDEPWRGPTCMEDLLAGEAQAFLPYALGHKFVLVEEAQEAQALETMDTLWEAALRLRYMRGVAEFSEALAKARELMPEPGPVSRALATWVRSALIDDGAKEEDMENVRELADLEPVVHSFWGAERLAARREGREEGRAATLVRLARRKFGAETADRLASLLADVSESERVDEIADLIIDCASGDDLLAQAASKGRPANGFPPDAADM